MATKSTKARQFDWFTTLAEIEILGVNLFVVCHQRLGMNANSPGSSTKVCLTALANKGNRSKSGLSTLTSERFSLSGDGYRKESWSGEKRMNCFLP